MSETLHSDYYRRDDGAHFKKAIVDALTANPSGMTVPEIRDWLYRENHYVTVALYSFLRSFGTQQASRAGQGRVNENVVDRYQRGWPEDEQPDRQVKYALTERLDWWSKRMLVHKMLSSVGSDSQQIDGYMLAINGARQAGISRYAIGTKPLKVWGIVEGRDRNGRLTTRYGLIDYDPHAIDWGTREMAWRARLEDELARKTRRTAILIDLLQEADRIFTRQPDRWA